MSSSFCPSQLIMLLKMFFVYHIFFHMKCQCGCPTGEQIVTGKYLSGSGFKKLYKSSILFCALSCKGHIMCKSFQLNTATRACILNMEDEHCGYHNLLDDSNFIYSNIGNWPEEFSRSCKEHTCTRHEQCKVARNGLPVCVPSVQEGVHYTTSFEVHLERKNWTEAQATCSRRCTGSLAVVNNMEKHLQVLSLLNQLGIQFAWLGATDVVEEGTWVWSSAEVMDFNMWTVNGGGQPNNMYGEQHCLEMSAETEVNGIGWFDSGCEMDLPFVCEIMLSV